MTCGSSRRNAAGLRVMRGGLRAGIAAHGRGGCGAGRACRRPGSAAAGGSAGSDSRCRPARPVSPAKPASNSAAGSSGRSPGNDATSVSPSNVSPPDRFARERRADDRRQFVAPARDRRLARRAYRRERDDVDRGAGEFRALDRALGHAREEALEPVVAHVMQVVGLGGGEQDAVDARAEQRAGKRRAAGAEGGEDRGERAFEIAARASGPALKAASASTSTIWRSSRAKWSRIERPHHHVLVGLVAPLHHRPERSRARLLRRTRSSGAKVSAGEPARSPGIRKRPGGSSRIA